LDSQAATLAIDVGLIDLIVFIIGVYRIWRKHSSSGCSSPVTVPFDFMREKEELPKRFFPASLLVKKRHSASSFCESDIGEGSRANFKTFFHNKQDS
jgi:hypothetical protein